VSSSDTADCRSVTRYGCASQRTQAVLVGHSTTRTQERDRSGRLSMYEMYQRSEHPAMFTDFTFVADSAK
jgi:hypothetical protein